MDPIDSNNAEIVESESGLSNGEKFKRHLQENEEFYIGLAAGLITGAMIGVMIQARPLQLINMVSPVFNNSNNSFLGGYMSKIVRNDITGEISETVGLAAERAGVGVPMMSKHLNGYSGYASIKGATYSIIGVGVGS